MDYYRLKLIDDYYLDQHNLYKSSEKLQCDCVTHTLTSLPLLYEKILAQAPKYTIIARTHIKQHKTTFNQPNNKNGNQRSHKQ